MRKFLKPFQNFPWLLAIILFLLMTGCTASNPAGTPAPQPTRDMDQEQIFIQQLNSMNPTAVPIYQAATTAMDSGEYAISKQLYEQVILLAPEFSTAYRRLGSIEYYANKNTDRAIELTRKAVELEPDSFNKSSLSLLLILKNTPADLQEAYTLATSAVDLLPDDETANLALLLSASSLNYQQVARQADETLLRVAPSNSFGHYFAGLFAAQDGKWEKAEAELLYSQQLGMTAEIVQETLNNGIAGNALLIRSLRGGAIATGFWLLGLGILYLAGTVLSQATIRALNQPQFSREVQVKPAERTIRSIYRALIVILSLYYYISLPFVILLLLLIAGGAYYIFLKIGTIPIQIAVILVIVVIGSLLAILRSLFIRIKETIPGHRLQQMDAPELWNLVEQVARKLGIRPVDSITITPGAEIAVNEKGSILKLLRGAGKRNLLLGMGVLTGLTQGQLAAILAHEYGHFSGRDTAGGNLATQVYISLNQMAFRLARNRAATIINPAWLFVMGYQRIFLRVTLGASRLQETLADRYAALEYGSTNCIEGLKSVIKQAIAFQLHANYEVRKSVELNRPVNNLYALPMDEKLVGEMENQFDAMMKRPTKPYDSHPAPRDRIAWIEGMHIPDYPMQDNPSAALKLLPDPEGLQCEMTSLIIKSVKR